MVKVERSIDYLKKGKSSSETFEGAQHVKQITSQRKTLRFKRSDDNPELPENFKVGQAIGAGDCFFDSVAKGLKQLKPEMDFTVKSLREVCKRFAQSQLENDQSWLKGALRNEDEPISVYVPRIEFTVDDIEQESGSVNVLGLTSPIWGRSEIEGRIICKECNVKLHVVEKHVVEGKELWLDQIVNSEGCGSMNSIDYNEENTIHIINRGNAHFEPILRTQETQYNGRKSRDKSIPSYNSLREYLALSKSSNKPSISSAPYSNDSIVPHPGEFRAKNNIHIVSCKQQDDTHNCGFSVLENAKGILKDANHDPANMIYLGSNPQCTRHPDTSSGYLQRFSKSQPQLKRSSKTQQSPIPSKSIKYFNQENQAKSCTNRTREREEEITIKCLLEWLLYDRRKVTYALKNPQKTKMIKDLMSEPIFFELLVKCTLSRRIPESYLVSSREEIPKVHLVIVAITRAARNIEDIKLKKDKIMLIEDILCLCSRFGQTHFFIMQIKVKKGDVLIKLIDDLDNIFNSIGRVHNFGIDTQLLEYKLIPSLPILTEVEERPESTLSGIRSVSSSVLNSLIANIPSNLPTEDIITRPESTLSVLSVSSLESKWLY